MRCSVCLHDYKGPMLEISCGPVCDSCWSKSTECAEMDERMEQFQEIRRNLERRFIKNIDIGAVKHLLPSISPIKDEAWLYAPTTAHPYHIVRVWRGWSVRNCFQDISFAKPGVSEIMKDFI